MLDRYAAREDARAGRGDAATRMDAYDIAGACQTRARLPRGAQQLVHPPQPRRASGGASATRTSRPPTTRSAPRSCALCRVASPLLPFLTDEIHRGLTGGKSVHLSDWPDAAALPRRPRAGRATWIACATCAPRRSACAAQQNVRVRQPLATLIDGRPRARAPRALPRSRARRGEREGACELSEEIEAFASFRLQLNSRALGPRLGGEMKKTLAAAKAGRLEARRGRASRSRASGSSRASTRCCSRRSPASPARRSPRAR